MFKKKNTLHNAQTHKGYVRLDMQGPKCTLTLNQSQMSGDKTVKSGDFQMLPQRAIST